MEIDPSPDDFIDSDRHVIENLLQMTHLPLGIEITLKSHQQLYASGTAEFKRGLIILPDIRGWKSGRARYLADYFGSCDLLCVVPNYYSRNVNEPRKGDIGKCELTLLLRSAVIADTVAHFSLLKHMGRSKSSILETKMKPIIREIIDFMRKEGVEKMALLGIEWFLQKILLSFYSNPFTGELG